MLRMETSGETKIGKLNMTTTIQKYVIRLDVTALSSASKIKH